MSAGRRLAIHFSASATGRQLARPLTPAGIGFETADNVFLHLSDPAEAQRLADSLVATALHRHLDEWARRCGPVLRHFRNGVHWSFMQVEHATDVVFRQQARFQPLYEAIVRTSVHVVKAEHVATFLGRKLSSKIQGEVGNDFSTRIQGTRIRHHMGPASLKRLRLAPASSRALSAPPRGLLLQAPPPRGTAQRRARLQARSTGQINLQPRRPAPTHARRPERYLAFMACLDNPDAAQRALAKMAAPAKIKGRSYRGFDLFLDPDYRLFLTLARGKWSISSFRAGDLREHIPGLTTGRSSYLIKRLRTHGLIKKVAHTYKYFFTKLGRRVVVTALVIREYFVQPSLVRNAL